MLDDTFSFAAIGPVISVSFSSGSDTKVTPSPIASKRDGFLLCQALHVKAASRIEIELGPLRARERPFVLVPLDELVDVAHLELDLRLILPAASSPFRK